MNVLESAVFARQTLGASLGANTHRCVTLGESLYL